MELLSGRFFNHVRVQEDVLEWKLIPTFVSRFAVCPEIDRFSVFLSLQHMTKHRETKQTNK